MTVGEPPVVLVVHDLFFSFLVLCAFARARVFVDIASFRGGRTPPCMQGRTETQHRMK